MAETEHIPIRTLASLTGVKPITLRAWERRYGLLEPVRTAGGHRLYTHDHVELVRRVVALTERGVPISRVRSALEPQREKPAGPWRDRLERMAAAIARFDELELDRIQEEALSIHPVEQVNSRLLVPLLEHLGERWQSVKGGIAEEHFFATYMRSKLGARLLHLGRHAQGPRLLAACAPGEQHEIGLLLFCLEGALQGLRPVVLGADTPLAEMAEAQKRSACAAIVISCSIDPAPGTLDRELAALVRAVDVPVFVGGGASVGHRAAVAAAGAEAVGSNLQDGVRLVRARLERKAGRKR